MNLKKISIVFLILLLFLIPSFSYATQIGIDTVNNRVFTINNVPTNVVDYAYSVFDVTDDKDLLIIRRSSNAYRVILIPSSSYNYLYITKYDGYTYSIFRADKYYDAPYTDVTFEDGVVTNSTAIKDYGYGYGSQDFMKLYGEDNSDGSRYIWIYYQKDIYTGENHDEIFFQAPPQGTLAPIVAQVEMKTVLQEIIKILPMILVVVVSFLGLRKGLRMLLMLLRRS